MKKIVFAFAFLAVSALSAPITADATGLSAPVEIEGFAWSSTIGWISMNCANDGLPGCATSNYKVQIETDGRLTGYAWSSNIGWIKFDGLSGFPSGIDTVSVSARAKTGDTYPNLTLEGWARACAVFASGCAGALKSPTELGGWDGWISLGGTSTDGNSYGIEFVSRVATGNSFAWGGPINVGWIDFSPTPVSGSAIPPVTLANVTDITIPSVTYSPGTVNAAGYYNNVTFSPTILGIPDGVTVNWTLTLGGTALTDSGTVTQTGAVTTLSSTPTLNNVPFSTPGMYVFRVDTPLPGTVTPELDEDNRYEAPLSLAFPPPTISITGPEAIRSGETALIEWSISAPYPMTCTAAGAFAAAVAPIVVGGVSGPPPVVGTQSGSAPSTELLNAARFEVSCVVGSDTYREEHQVEVIPTFQEV